jgi:hypothetical protein
VQQITHKNHLLVFYAGEVVFVRWEGCPLSFAGGEKEKNFAGF